MVNMAHEALHADFDFYVNHHHELAEKYEGRYIVLKNQEVIADYPSAFEAYTDMDNKKLLGTCIIQYCSADPASYTTQIFSPIVYFSPL
jgi:hypothetical protein